MQAVFDALTSPVRREVLWLIWNDELTAGDIAAQFDVSMATISSHLARLREAGLVTMRVDGNFRRYRCNRDAVRSVAPLLAVEESRWMATDDLPEPGNVITRRTTWLTVSADVPVTPTVAFDAFTSSSRFSSWLGTPVHIDGGRFAATLAWGTEVRGHYEVVARPHLIAMSWDFEDAAVPVPGQQLLAYLRVTSSGVGCSTVRVDQRADGDVQAAFLETAWTFVLGRLLAAYDKGGHRGH